ncbi:hypothetical protein EGX98_02625 [Fusobacterium necrophorum]|uniref:acyltransferase family protein n=1 Tax=Fusobacterium necrophorum TaxID=859 RepID=UPI000887C49D|nr:hypothetical protein EGX98_02625 [Fusobacterium necrophorum]AZW08957.1 hypothetical protein EO219_04770 [Fusobacterium necrophorum subsp. necrophorum]SDB39813.1 Acyltransferase family protein [Fusobacterium necrophorum]SQD09943.1 Fucose 4-O-acetylase and related acetyltransferases [Fusobacterium necrophorum subsp. necrophorum]
MRELKEKDILFLQGIGILLVVLGHSGQQEMTYLKKFIYSFHMPLFMFISGYLFYFKDSNTIKLSYFNFVKNKFIRLIAPYFIISSMAYIPKYFLQYFAMRKINLNIEAYIHSILYPWDNPIVFFWFLPTIFIILVLSFGITRIISKRYLLTFLFFSLLLSIASKKYILINFLNISGVFYYLFFFILGSIYCRYKNYINSFLEARQNLFYYISFFFLCLNCFFFGRRFWSNLQYHSIYFGNYIHVIIGEKIF